MTGSVRPFEQRNVTQGRFAQIGDPDGRQPFVEDLDRDLLAAQSCNPHGQLR